MLIAGSLSRKRSFPADVPTPPRRKARLRVTGCEDSPNTERVIAMAVAFIDSRNAGPWLRPAGHRCGPDCPWKTDGDNWLCVLSGSHHHCGVRCGALVETRGSWTCLRTGAVVSTVTESTFEEVMQSSVDHEPLDSVEKLRRAAGRAVEAIAHPPRQTNAVRNNYDGRSIVGRWITDAMSSYEPRMADRLPLGLLDYVIDTTLRLWVLVSLVEAVVHRERKSSYGIRSHCLVSLVYLSRNDGFSTGLVDAHNNNLLPNSKTLAKTGLARFLATRPTFTPTNKTMRLLVSRVPQDRMDAYVSTMKRSPDCDRFDAGSMEVDE